MPAKKCDELLIDVAVFLTGKYPARAERHKRSQSVKAREDAAKESLDAFRDNPEFIRVMSPLVDMEHEGNDWARLSALREAWGCVAADLRDGAKPRQDERVLTGVNA